MTDAPSTSAGAQPSRPVLGPTGLPHGFAARYATTPGTGDVGGDSYDVIALDNDRIGIVVGDCPGENSSPAKALESFARGVPPPASLFCAVIDPASSTVRYASAGYLPPIVVALDGSRRLLDRAEAQTSLPPGATLLLYSEGLVQRRHESLIDGIERAGEALAKYRYQHPDDVADHLITEPAAAAGFDDDVALLVYRHPPAPLRVSLPAEPTSLATVRERLREWLPAAAVDSERAADVLLAVGEAASNATEHASRTTSHDVELTVTARVSNGSVALTVADDGRWRPPLQSDGSRGHGISVMKALVDAVKLRPSQHGTTVEMLKELNP